MNSAEQPLVSIVTPMYNEEKHLAVCIESLLAQTYRNWECLIADNCSTDGSPRIARDYADKDPRIRVQRNDRCLRAVANFNAALRKISPSSKYCKVVFADDFIFPECLERMVSLAEANPSVGIVGAYGLQGDSVMWTGLPIPVKWFRAENSAVDTFSTACMCLGRQRRCSFVRNLFGIEIPSLTNRIFTRIATLAWSC